MIIQKEWEDFEKKVIPENAPRGQRQDMKMAYLAGVYVALTAMDTIVDKEPNEDKAVVLVAALYRECKDLIDKLVPPKEGEPT